MHCCVHCKLQSGPAALCLSKEAACKCYSMAQVSLCDKCSGKLAAAMLLSILCLCIVCIGWQAS